MEKGVDNPRYYVQVLCNQVVSTNGTVLHCLIDAHGIIQVSGVHRCCGQWDDEGDSPSIDDDWGINENSMSKKNGGISIVKVRTRWWMVWLDFVVQIAFIHTQFVQRAFRGWFCLRSKWTQLIGCDEWWWRFVRLCIPRSVLYRMLLAIEYLGLPFYQKTIGDLHDEE